MNRSAFLTTLSGATAALAIAAAAYAQSTTPETLEQIERQYPRMKAVHIKKCDRNGDGIYNHTEQLCVASIYRVMYLNDR